MFFFQKRCLKNFRQKLALDFFLKNMAAIIKIKKKKKARKNQPITD